MPSEQAFRLTIWIVALVFAIIFFAFLFFYKPLKTYLAKKHTTKTYYKEVNKIALYSDFYLVNQFKYLKDSDKPVYFDHILAGEKYIYLITDKYYDGELDGRGDDNNWFYYHKGKEKRIIKNPLIQNKKELKRFSRKTDISRDLLVGIVLINDDCFVTPFDNIEGESLLVPLSQLDNVVQNFESKEIPCIDEKTLQDVVLILHDENLNNKGKNEREKRK